MNELFSDILNTILSGLVLIMTGTILAILVSCFHCLMSWIKNKLASSEHRVLQQYLVTLEEIVMNAVMAKEQTLVPVLKASSGKLTPEDAVTVKNSAIASIKRALPDDMFEKLSKNNIDADELISNAIEKVVYLNKH